MPPVRKRSHGGRGKQLRNSSSDFRPCDVRKRMPMNLIAHAGMGGELVDVSSLRRFGFDSNWDSITISNLIGKLKICPPLPLALLKRSR